MTKQQRTRQNHRWTPMDTDSLGYVVASSFFGEDFHLLSNFASICAHPCPSVVLLKEVLP